VSVLYSVFSSSEALRVFQSFQVFDYEYDEMLTSSSFVSACVTGITETEKERERLFLTFQYNFYYNKFNNHKHFVMINELQT